MTRPTSDSNIGPDRSADENDAAFGAPQRDTAEKAVPSMPAPEPVHRWLDGETIPEAELKTPDAKPHVKFWAKVNQETERRHRMRTPVGLDAIIMDKLKTPVVKDD